MKNIGNKKRNLSLLGVVTSSLLLLPFLSSCLPPPEVLPDICNLISIENNESINITDLDVNIEVTGDKARVNESYIIKNTAKTLLNSKGMFLLSNNGNNNYSINIENNDAFAAEETLTFEEYQIERGDYNKRYYDFDVDEYFKTNLSSSCWKNEEDFNTLKVVKFFLNFEKTSTINLNITRYIKLGGLYEANPSMLSNPDRYLWYKTLGSNMAKKVSKFSFTCKSDEAFPRAYLEYGSSIYKEIDSDYNFTKDCSFENNVDFNFKISRFKGLGYFLTSPMFLVTFIVLILPFGIMIQIALGFIIAGIIKLVYKNKNKQNK